MIGVDDELGPVLLRAIEERVDVFERALRQAVDQGELTLSNGVTASAGSVVAFLLGVNLLSKTVRDEQALWETCRSFLAGFGVPEQALVSAA